MRIISGNFRGRKLASFQGTTIRPTSDHIREAIFSILSGTVPMTMVLDLFAGTGALGLEALSRGAAKSVFIDSHKKARALIAKNLMRCGIDPKNIILRCNILKNLNCLTSIKFRFNLVFMDPPYNLNMVKPALLNLLQSSSLAPGACVVVEHALTETIPDPIFAFKCIDRRKYGKTLVSFFEYMI
jgi:16S rRNA (guanine966-N2)-methyltransferase